MNKKNLSIIEQEQKLLELESLYYQNPQPELIPDRLYHFIREDDPQLVEEALQKIKKEGLKNAKNPRNTTNFINQRVQRPQGIYFWDEPINEDIHIEVYVNQLNLNKLYVFPHAIADIILEIDKKYEVSNEFWQQLKKVSVAIPFENYQGQFQAEYIYTIDIPAKLLTINKALTKAR